MLDVTAASLDLRNEGLGLLLMLLLSSWKLEFVLPFVDDESPAEITDDCDVLGEDEFESELLVLVWSIECC